jgi:hypothetical protein
MEALEFCQSFDPHAAYQAVIENIHPSTAVRRTQPSADHNFGNAAIFAPRFPQEVHLKRLHARSIGNGPPKR